MKKFTQKHIGLLAIMCAISFYVNAQFPDPCCMDMSAYCLSCNTGMTVEEYCGWYPDTDGCEMYSSGCTNPTACNYNPNVWVDDETCMYPELGYDCVGNCFSDSDSDGICDEFEIILEEVTPDMFTAPTNTGANQTVGVNTTVFDQFENGQIGAFYDIDGDGSLECVGLESISSGFFGLALWGDDYISPNVDGLGCGLWPEFYILHDGNVIIVDPNTIANWDVDETCFNGYNYSFIDGEIIQEAIYCQYSGYCTNDIVNINGANLFGGNGCTDVSACNVMFMYSNVDYDDDGSCTFAETNYDCNSDCLNDVDNDGVCDDDELLGCTDATACNYDATPTTDTENTLCVYFEGIDECCCWCSGETDGTGVVICYDEEDDDGCEYYCNEVIGCQDATACNYMALATDAGDCTYSTDLDACATCSGGTDGTGVIVDNDTDDDGVCNSEDVFPEDSTESVDSDGDGVGDNADVFPNDASETLDTDGDGYGDNIDACDNDSNGYIDTDGDLVCDASEISGCTDPNFQEYFSEATEDDGSCMLHSGCSIDIVCCGAPDLNNSCPDSIQYSGFNYDFGFDDWSCDVVDCIDPNGCMELTACNYNPLSWEEDGSCLFPEVGYDCEGNCLNDCDDDGVCDGFETNIELVNHPLFLPSGWSMFGFTCYNSINVVEALQPIIQDVIIVKDYTGNAYLPEWNYNGIGDFIYSYGYQIKLQNTVNNFQFCQTIILTE
jgi:hypothetical protein